MSRPAGRSLVLTDVVLGAMLAEALWLLVGPGRRPQGALLALAPGACLAAASSAQARGARPLAALALAAALPLHLADLLRRPLR